MALTATEEKELKKLETINSPVPSQKKRMLKLKQLKNIKRKELPKKPKIVAITDKYSSGKFGSPSTKKPVTMPNRQGKRTPTEQARIDRNKAIVPNLKKMKLKKKADKKPIIKSTSGSVSLPKKRLKQPTVSKVIKKPIIKSTSGSVRKPNEKLKKPTVLKSKVSKTPTVNPNSKTGQYKAPKPKEESTFSSLLKFLRNKLSPSKSVSKDKIKKALPSDGTYTAKQIKSLQEALTPPVSYKERTSPSKAMPKKKVVKNNNRKPVVKKKVLSKKFVATKKVPNYTPKGNKAMLTKSKKSRGSGTTIPTDKDQEEINKNVKADPKVTAKLEVHPAVRAYIKKAGSGDFDKGLKTFESTGIGKSIEKGLASLGGGRMRTALESASDSAATEFLNENLKDMPELNDSQRDYIGKRKGGKVSKKKGGMVKRSYGGKVKRNMGGMVSPRKKVVFRRGGGRALRGMGKAIYSNKMY